MMTPIFLSLDEVLEIHEDQLARYGGKSGLLSLPLLESALAQPQASFSGHFLLSDLFEMAAAYLFFIVQNHPFCDGNKRVGVAAAIAFLLLNGADVNLTNEELEALVIDTATGKLGREQIAVTLRSHAA